SILFGAIMLVAYGQKTVEKFEIDGGTFYGTKELPSEILGFYQYEKDKEPIVDVKEGGTGFFQVHGVPKYPVEFWVQTDEKGEIQKETGPTGNYRMILIVKYGSNGESGWKGANAGTFTRISVAVAKDMGYAIILGERFKAL
ncbi:MAG: hypothetical protein KY428_10180, partial [Bacteroidetes bacterium]|nr:hypothetical protein [Bacteroidota bacterium]